MGDDFRNRQCYAGSGPVESLRFQIEATIRAALSAAGYAEVQAETDATRSIVIGPARRWIFVGDTAGSTETSDSAAFDDLSRALSTVVPVVDIQMSDSAAVHL